MPEPQDVEAFLEHIGVKGMKWGKRKASGTNGGKDNFFSKPSVAKAALLGSYGSKSAYTNPAALANRTKAGKLRVATILTGVGAMAVSKIGQNNQGAQVVSGLLRVTSTGLGIGSVVVGTIGASQESQARKAS